jgi:hypothetical protein
MILINTSDKECHSRRINIYSLIGECYYCNKEKKILSVDTSDEEYCNFDCCLDCFTKLLEEQEK